MEMLCSKVWILLCGCKRGFVNDTLATKKANKKTKAK